MQGAIKDLTTERKQERGYTMEKSKVEAMTEHFLIRRWIYKQTFVLVLANLHKAKHPSTLLIF
jgi:hypothetical protein